MGELVEDLRYTNAVGEDYVRIPAEFFDSYDDVESTSLPAAPGDPA